MLESFLQYNPKYQRFQEQIQDGNLRDMYLYYNFWNYSFSPDEDEKDSTNNDIDFSEDYLLEFLQYNKFIIYHISDIYSNSTMNSNPNKDKDGINSVSQCVNAILCYERACIIIEQIKTELISQILLKLEKQASLLNISPVFEIKERTINEIQAKEEIDNFSLHFLNDIQNNEFVKSTISPILGYFIRRFFYPTHYFNDTSFFHSFDEQEYNTAFFMHNLFSAENTINIDNCIDRISHEASLLNDVDNYNFFQNIERNCDFQEEQIIKLRTIYINDMFTFYLVIDLNELHIYLMKKLNDINNLDKLKREIYFCQNYSHRCLCKFFGFVKNGEEITGFLYEYLCNGSLESYVLSNKDKISDAFSMMTIIRVFQAIEYLNSNSLIHRDLKPLNIFLNNNFLPYVIDFDTIIHPREENESSNTENTNDLGSVLYMSPEQFAGKHVSYPTDIYSFGLIVYFLIEKKHMKSQKSTLHDSKIQAKGSTLLQNLYQQCIKTSPDERPSIYSIREILTKEASSYHYLQQYFSNDEKIDIKNAIAQFIFEKVVLLHKDQNEMKKIYNDILTFQSSLVDKKEYDNSPLFNYYGEIYQRGDIVNQDYSKAKKYYESSANENDPESFYRLGKLYAKGQGVEKNYSQAIKYLELAANQSHPKALWALGNIYVHGDGVQQDYSKALKYYELSAEMNNSDAFNSLGYLYEHGFGVEKDYLVAKEYFTLSAELDNSVALINLGKLYLFGKGVETNYRKAIEYFESSAEMNNSHAYNILGEIFEEGIGVKRNLSKAKMYFELSAELNNADAFYKLADLCVFNDGIKPNFKEAREYYEISANFDNPSSLVNLGIFYEKGFDVEIDYLKARKYYEASAKLNHPYAFVKLGDLYLNGKGTQKDYLKALEYYEIAAQDENIFAYNQLALLYKKGYGVKQDYLKAKEYYQLMAQNNISIGFLKLGNLYKKGRGVNQDYQKVQLYYELAARLDHPTALFYLSEFYTAGNIFNTDIFKAIQYCYKCMDISNWGIQRYCSGFIYNKYNYHAMNNLGLVYITTFQDLEKSTKFIKEAALNEYPFAQNNFGLLNQFFLNNTPDAKYMYQRSSKHNFALAEFNLGYLKGKNNLIEKSIKHYLNASAYEDEPLIFHNHRHIDNQLEISKTFIICLANLKLTDYYLYNEDYEESKKYFAKSLHKIRDDKLQYQFRFHFNIEDKGNPFSYIKKYILNFPAFNLMNHPESNMELKNILNRKEFNGKNVDKTNKKLNEILFHKKIELPKDKPDFSEKTKDNNYLESDEFKIQSKLMKTDEFDVQLLNQNKEELIFEDSSVLYDFIVSNNEIKILFIEEIKEIIHIMQEILYVPPYRILFGRINIEKIKPKEKNIEIKDINEIFYEGPGKI
ncbi:hypothetical protein M9Y10_024715 [Tritrichomonas musculus]|uniref:Protein kinase domain-containing protein n=1 Tax=Tritrichomonas musculus TaxID=1915356 RepID=A0ABR2HB24_9EUKA